MRNKSLAGFIVTIGLVILMIASLGCIKRIERQASTDFNEYFPLNLGDSWSYTEVFDSSVVTSVIGNLATVTNYDTSGNIISWDDYITRTDGVFHKNTVTNQSLSIHYEPAIPNSPWSAIIGDTLLINSVEIRNDSLNSHIRVRLEYKTMSVDTIAVPAGVFEDCIKIQVKYTTLDNNIRPKFDGITNMWFARGIGLIRYSAQGSTAELKAANVGGEIYPKE